MAPEPRAVSLMANSELQLPKISRANLRVTMKILATLESTMALRSFSSSCTQVMVALRNTPPLQFNVKRFEHRTCTEQTQSSYQPVCCQNSTTLVLSVSLLLAKGEQPLCHIIESPENPLLSKDGDMIIGGAFSIHSGVTMPSMSFTEKPKSLICSRFNLRELRFAQAMVFVIEEINRDSSLLPNISVGYRIYDNCGSRFLSMKAAMALMNGQELTAVEGCSGQAGVQAIIGESESSPTIVLSRTTGPFKIPVVRHT
ncbi:hypothetical protein MHYP_G00129030 [Metynnis hypsauchen]